MQEGTRLWKLLRPETFTLVVVPTAVLILLASLGMLGGRRFGVNFWTSFVYLRFFGWQWFCVLCSIALGYLVFSVIAYVVQYRRSGHGEPAELPPLGRPAQGVVERLRMAGSLAGLIALYTYAFIANFVAMNALCQPDRLRVVWASEFLMRVDHAIFGTYVPFETHEQALFQTLSAPMLSCYLGLSWVVSLVLVALCVFHAKQFRQYVLAFLMVMFLALPGWFALPAVSPSEAYRLNRLRASVPIDIALETAAPIVHLHPKVVEFLGQIEAFESAPSQGVFAITCFPSLHVAWGMIAVWFGCTLYARSVFLLVPWGMLNAMGAIFTLQHYAIDVVAGMAVAAIAVVLVRRLVALEARQGLAPPVGYDVFGFIRQDAVIFGQAWRFVKRSASQTAA